MRITLTRLTTFCLLASSLAACSSETVSKPINAHTNHSAHQMAEAPARPSRNMGLPPAAMFDKGFRLENIVLRPPLPGRDTAMASLMITNQNDEADRLIAARSPLSEAVEIHTMLNENGVMKMRRLENGIEIPAGETAVLKGGADHIMLFKTRIPDGLKSTDLILEFEKAGTVRAIAIVDDGNLSGGH